MLRRLVCVYLISSLLLAQDAAPPAEPVGFRADTANRLRIDPGQLSYMVVQQQGEDPLIGIWSSSVNGFQNKIAIVKNPQSAVDTYDFVAISISPWPGFEPGEPQLFLSRTKQPGFYTGKEKWKDSAVGNTFWDDAQIALSGPKSATQRNHVDFKSALGNEWTLTRESMAPDYVPKAELPPASVTPVAATAPAAQAAPPPVPQSASASLGSPFILEDGTPVKLRTGRTISSADAHVGDTLDFEVLEEVKIGDIVVIPQGGVAWATVTEAEHKKRMGRGGKLNLSIDNVKLANGQKAPLRAVQGGNAGGHVGAMTGAIVATAIVFWPAAPLFLFMHGKDLTIPKGAAITAYINGNVPLDRAAFLPRSVSEPVMAVAAPGLAQEQLTISSTPSNAEIELDGAFVGDTPSTLALSPGEHTITLTHKGFQRWERKLRTTSGTVNLNVELEPAPTP